MDRSLILTAAQIDQKLERIAHEIHEVCFREKEVVICAIQGNGEIIADRIVQLLQEISEIKPILCHIEMDKENPIKTESRLDISSDAYKNKTIIVIDDVSNSGKTLIYAIKHFLAEPIHGIKTLVLVDRNHNRYPVQADFVGLTISTTLKEHIEVIMTGKDKGVYLK